MTDETLGAGGVHPLLPNAVQLHQAGRLLEASKIYELILADVPEHFDALHLLGVIALQEGRFEEAQRRIIAALQQDPQNSPALGNLTAAYLRAGQFDHALEWGRRALQAEPQSIDAQINIATTLHELGRFEEAAPVFKKALESSPTSTLALNLLGSCLLKIGDAGGAAKAFEAATVAAPIDADSWANLSVALNALSEHERALECANKSIELRGDSCNALAAQGASLLELGKVDEAIASYREAIKHSPSIQILCAFANALITSGLTEEAAVVLQQAIDMDATNPSARWILAIASVKPICDTVEQMQTGRDKLSAALSSMDKWFKTSGEPSVYYAVGAAQPFYLAYHELNNVELLSKYGALCISWMKSLDTTLVSKVSRSRPAGKMRIGIASGHIRDHSVWVAVAKGWAHRLNREKFEIHLFALNPTSDKVTAEAKAIADRFDGGVKGVADWIDSIQKANIDALIYPAIGMDALTYQLASLRLAPIQINSWGHPETSGLATVDYYLSGNAFEPKDADQNYSEKLVRLPNFGAFVEPLEPKMKDVDLDSLNLPKRVPLLLCPGTPFKYTPNNDWIWVEIARGLTNSGGRLVFFGSTRGSMYVALIARLRRAFEAAGVDFAARVCILPVLDRQRFFGLLQKSTLMLDTLGFSGFNTALQGMECGLPVLAYEGKFMRGRLASAIMRNMGMPELVATSPQEFVSKAIEFASDERKLKKLRAEIPKRRKALFYDDTPIRALEEFLEREISKQRAG